ncbi:PREDICTED: protocadherin beta-14-like [Poecilia mexicana]|uniref:protocadherin beta-14-like n=1 Tax=Poecilia mexicana TaxID=48701 RepID=UPI00072EA316|nr:PREDICTED: protocadherin beta-14-like [Poecilia mexicana]
MPVGMMRWQMVLLFSLLRLGVLRGQVSYSVPEEMKSGSVIGNIAHDLGLGVDRLKSGKARIYTGDTEEYVELNRERGVLNVKQRIDRETLCGQTMPCALHFQIILENPMEFYTVTVEITDINDNPPTFERGEMKYEISESALIGARFVLEKAIDDDVGVNGLSSYTLKPNDNFVLKTTSRVDGTKHAEMVLQKPLDREKNEHLSLTLTAVDGGEPQLTGTMQIIITVLDVNDNPPVCSKPEYKVSVAENAPAGTIITTVKASDKDKDNNGKIMYTIPKSAAASLFQINSEDGVLMLNGNIDYEKRRIYELDIQVSDLGGLSDACKVIVDVTDINDNPPSINVMSKSTALPENAKPGTVVTMLNIQDPDSNENGRVMCVLSENSAFSIKTSTNNFFTVVTEGELDREKASQYNITVTCSDEGVPSLSTSVTLTLQISDVNDNAPVFERSLYEAYIVAMGRLVLLFFSFLFVSLVTAQVSYSIPEESPKGSLIGNIARDLGLDSKRLSSGNARIFTGDNTDYIELKRERGVLIVKEKIDRELLCGQTTPCALHFQVILENPMEFYTVAVEIVDINDNAPLFEKSDMKFNISESAVIGAKFLLERAIDPDVGMNGLQSYFLSKTEHFALKLKDQPDGEKIVEMVLQKPLDREKQEELFLVLTAVDGGEPQLTGTAKIHVTVLDANDNAPVFTKPLYKATIPENAPKGTVVIRVSASDADKGLNSKILYSISNTIADIRDLFKMNESNGDLILADSIDYEKARYYQIHVQASDGGLTDSCKVTVDVTDINDNKPVINVISQINVISEDSKPETIVTMVNVQDIDSGENGKVHCAINEQIPFTLKLATGGFFNLVTESKLDRETGSGYNITVLCSDEGVPSLSSSVTLTLQVSDVNDNAPVFERSSYEAYIVENNTPGVSIFTVKAKDTDWNQNARVSYILEDSSVNGVPVSSYVSVSADSGVIHAVRSFDYEQIKEFVFITRAQDGGSPPLSSNVTVKILIQDQNDNPPQVLYPVQTGGSMVAEMVSRSADVGYLFYGLDS